MYGWRDGGREGGREGWMYVYAVWLPLTTFSASVQVARCAKSMYVCMCVYTYIYIYIHTHVTHMCISYHIYIYIYIYTHTYVIYHYCTPGHGVRNRRGRGVRVRPVGARTPPEPGTLRVSLLVVVVV